MKLNKSKTEVVLWIVTALAAAVTVLLMATEEWRNIVV